MNRFFVSMLLMVTWLTISWAPADAQQEFTEECSTVECYIQKFLSQIMALWEDKNDASEIYLVDPEEAPKALSMERATALIDSITSDPQNQRALKIIDDVALGIRIVNGWVSPEELTQRVEEIKAGSQTGSAEFSFEDNAVVIGSFSANPDEGFTDEDIQRLVAQLRAIEDAELVKKEKTLPAGPERDEITQKIRALRAPSRPERRKKTSRQKTCSSLLEK